LIAQLLVMETKECPKPEHSHELAGAAEQSAEADEETKEHLYEAPDTAEQSAEALKVSQNAELEHSADEQEESSLNPPPAADSVAAPPDDSLTSAIGRLLELRTKEYMEAEARKKLPEEDAGSTHLSEDAESVDSAIQATGSPMPSTAAPSTVPDPLSASEDEELATPVLAQKAPCPKASKAAHTSKAALQKKSLKAGYAAQAQIAQCQMAQWQLAQVQAQWRAAQMVQWQHANFALQANQAAQSQAAWW